MIEPPFDIVLYNDFFNLSEIIALSHINKYYYNFCKEFIKNHIQKLNNVTVKLHRNRLFYKICPFNQWERFHKTYPNEYWHHVFGNQLSPEQLAVYYANFMDNYFFIRNLIQDKDWKVHSLWKCIAYPDGYIKTISKNPIETHSTYNSEIIISIKLYVSYIKHEGFHSSYITCKYDHAEIEYSYNFKTKNRIYIDEKILLSYLSNKSYKCIYSFDNNCKSNECGKWCGNNQECIEVFDSARGKINY